MSQGDELILDRRRHLDALGELGVAAYPNRFARTDSITALVEAHGGKSAEALESPRIETTAGGRILARKQRLVDVGGLHIVREPQHREQGGAPG